MDINGRRGPAATTEEVVQRHPREFALDVPERHVDARHGIVQHWPAPPVGADGKHRPDVLDVMHRAPDDLRLHILLDRGGDSQRTLSERGAAESVEVWLVGLDLDDYEANSFRRGENHPHVADPGSASITLIPGWWQQGRQYLQTRDVI
jgi:hypothetical protein